MDIHILKGTFQEKNGEVSQGTFQVIFHIPINNPVLGIAEKQASIVPDIEQNEIDALAAGTLIEVEESWNYTTNKTNNGYMQQLKDRWNELNTQENAKYDFAYKYWKVNFDATT